VGAWNNQNKDGKVSLKRFYTYGISEDLYLNEE
jgi:hypothetical protein